MGLSQTPSFLAVKVSGRMICRVSGSTRIHSLRMDTHTAPVWSANSYTRCIWAPFDPIFPGRDVQHFLRHGAAVNPHRHPGEQKHLPHGIELLVGQPPGIVVISGEGGGLAQNVDTRARWFRSQSAKISSS